MIRSETVWIAQHPVMVGIGRRDWDDEVWCWSKRRATYFLMWSRRGARL